MINVIKKDLQFEMLADIFYSEDSKNSSKLISNYYRDEQDNSYHIDTKEHIEIDLCEKTVITGPSRPKRMINAVNFIKRDNFEYRSDNHRAFYYPYFDICIVVSGNHSISS